MARCAALAELMHLLVYRPPLPLHVLGDAAVAADNSCRLSQPDLLLPEVAAPAGSGAGRGASLRCCPCSRTSDLFRSAASCSGSRELPRSSCPSAGASSALADRGGQRGKGKRFPLPFCPRVLSSAGPSLGLRWGGFSAGDEPFAVQEPAERGAERRLRWSDSKRHFPGSECSFPSPLPPGFILEV